MNKTIIILLFLITFILLIGSCTSNSIKTTTYKRNLQIPNQNDFTNYKKYQKEYLKLKQQQQQPLNTIQPISYPVSENCSNTMQALISDPNSPNIEMLLYSGFGFNELGNYDSCIYLPSNVSQYCIYKDYLDGLLPINIGVCYPSEDVCSKEDVLGLMTQYSILLALQYEMNLTVSNLLCFNNSYPTVIIEPTNGTWAITAISSFMALMVLIGTLIEYLFVIKLNQHRKKFSLLLINNNPYSLLNPKNYFDNTSSPSSSTSSLPSSPIKHTNLLSNLQDNGEDRSHHHYQQDVIGNSGKNGIDGNNNESFEPKFYDSLIERISISFDKDVQETSLVIKYFLCWSLIRNYKSLVGGSSSKRYFNSLDGIRTFSMCWVVLGHSLLFGAFGVGYDNLSYLATGPTMKSFAFQVIPAGEFAVDTFFMLSGFLVTYSVLSYLMKRRLTPPSNSSNNTYGASSSGKYSFGSIKFWAVYVVHRFFRLSPLYYFLIFASMWVVPLMGSGPNFSMLNTFLNQQCSSNWWTNLLYINNLYSSMTDECYAWGWYLANDMQFFLLTPFIIVLFLKWKLGAWLVVISMIFASVIGTTVISFKYQLTPFFDMLATPSAASQEASIMITDVYQKPWNRIGPYLVGILIAFIFCAPRLSKRVRYLYHRRLTRYILYSISLFITFFLVYIPYNFYQTTNGWSNSQMAVFTGFAHTSFTVGLGIFMLGSFYGYGGIVLWILELPIFKFFSKLTYSSYLVHPIVIMYRVTSMTNLLHYSITEFTIFYIGNLVTTFSVAIIIHLLIEKPFINLERFLFSSSSTSK